MPGHELAGVVTALGYGTTGLSVGQRVSGLADWHRDGTLAEYVAVEARNLAPLPGDVDFTVGASLPISGLTAWQGVFDHGRLQAGQTVLAHGAAGAVGTMVTQLARRPAPTSSAPDARPTVRRRSTSARWSPSTSRTTR
jgi:NADPH:quinone reductase-like Zn-dependent oxidoreductase